MQYIYIYIYNDVLTSSLSKNDRIFITVYNYSVFTNNKSIPEPENKRRIKNKALHP